MKLLNLGLLLSLSIFIVSCGGKSIPGVDGPDFYTTNQFAHMKFGIEQIKVNDEQTYEVRKIGDTYIKLAPKDLGEGSTLEFAIDVDAIANGKVDTMNPLALPGGRSLPTVEGGKLPSVSVAIPAFKNVQVYLGKKVYGLFFPIKLPQEINGVVWWELRVKGQKVGIVSVVGPDSNNENSGALVLIDLNNKTKKIFKKMQKLQNRM